MHGLHAFNKHDIMYNTLEIQTFQTGMLISGLESKGSL